MQIIKEQIRLNDLVSGGTMNLSIPLSSNVEFLGIQQQIDNLTSITTTGLINPASDYETRRYKSSTTPTIQFNFYSIIAYNGQSYSQYYLEGGQSSYIVGTNMFALDDIVSRNSNWLNSFYIADFYDSYDVYTQTKLFTTYLTKKGEVISGVPPRPIYTINNTNQLFYNYIPSWFIDSFENTKDVWVKFSFFNAKTGKLALFYNKDFTNSTPEKMYFKAEINRNTKTWKFISNSLSAYEFISSVAFVNKANSTVEEKSDIQQNPPSGNTFMYVSNKATYGDSSTYKPTNIGLLIVPPTVITNTVAMTSMSTAKGGGQITFDGNSPITSRGVYWATAPIEIGNELTVGNTNDGTGSGNFESNITGLALGTTYYVRAYAVNQAGWTWGEEVSFKAQWTPTVTTSPSIWSISQINAFGGGEVVNDGGMPNYDRGLVWSTGVPVYPTSPYVRIGNGVGAFEGEMTNLAANTAYNYRAFANNDVGVGYGETRVFNTKPFAMPLVYTMPSSGQTEYTADAGGSVVCDNGKPVSAYGVAWSTGEPSISGDHSVDGSGITGLAHYFHHKITGLTPDTTYYFKAYATNEIGTAYGDKLNFKTNPIVPTPPTVVTEYFEFCNYTSAAGRGCVTHANNAAVTQRGFVYNLPAYGIPAVDNTNSSKIADPYAELGFYYSTMSPLVAGTTYNARAYACNSAGVGYGEMKTFTTLAAKVPDTQTVGYTDLTNNSVVLKGMTGMPNGYPITEAGIYWGTAANPTAANNKLAGTISGGVFNVPLSGLAQGTTYHFRSYAINAIGTGYGTDMSFTTSAVPVTQINVSLGNGVINISPALTAGQYFPLQLMYNQTVFSDSAKITVMRNGTDISWSCIDPTYGMQTIFSSRGQCGTGYCTLQINAGETFTYSNELNTMQSGTCSDFEIREAGGTCSPNLIVVVGNSRCCIAR